MKLPDKKNRPKLPPKSKGGGAAARQRQFEMERGLDEEPPLEGSPSDTSGEERSTSADDKLKKPKKKS